MGWLGWVVVSAWAFVLLTIKCSADDSTLPPPYPLQFDGLPLIPNDEYLNAIAYNENEETTLTQLDTSVCTFFTSHTYLAETSDTVHATFIGDFASSGPHSVGSFTTAGAAKVVITTLSRKIGNLRGIYLENKSGVDGWLLRHLSCTFNGVTTYDFDLSTLVWLSNLDPTSHTYDTQHQEDGLGTMTLLYVKVQATIAEYSATGN